MRYCHPDVTAELQRAVPRYMPPIQMAPQLAEAIKGAANNNSNSSTRPSSPNTAEPPPDDSLADMEHVVHYAFTDDIENFDPHQEARRSTVSHGVGDP